MTQSDKFVNKTFVRLDYGDLNADGLQDLVFTFTNQIEVRYGNTRLRWNQTDFAIILSLGTEWSGFFSAQVRDFNIDGHADLLVSGRNASNGVIQIILYYGPVPFNTAFYRFTSPSSICSILPHIALIDNNAFPDVVITAGTCNSVNLLLSENGTIFRVRFVQSVGGDTISKVLSTDLENDGDNDIVFSTFGSVAVGADSRILVCRNAGTGVSFVVSTVYNSQLAAPNGRQIRDFALASMNDDTLADLIICGQGNGTTTNRRLVLFRGASGGTAFPSSLAVSLSTSSHCLSVSVADINRDGLLDVVSQRFLNPFVSTFTSVFFATGVGNSFSSPEPITIELDTPGSIQLVADIDNDGDRDIISFFPSNNTLWTNYHSCCDETVSITSSTSTTSSTTTTSTTTTSSTTTTTTTTTTSISTTTTLTVQPSSPTLSPCLLTCEFGDCINGVCVCFSPAYTGPNCVPKRTLGGPVLTTAIILVIVFSSVFGTALVCYGIHAYNKPRTQKKVPSKSAKHAVHPIALKMVPKREIKQHK